MKLDPQREALARAETAIAFSMQEPTVASRMDGLRRQFDAAGALDQDAFVSALIARLVIASR